MEKEENEEAEEEEEEDEGALQVDCHRTLLWWRFCLCPGSSVSVFKIVLKPLLCFRSQDVSCSGAPADRRAQRQKCPHRNHCLSASCLQGSRQVGGLSLLCGIKHLHDIMNINRPDIVSLMHNNIAKNKRQPYCVSEPAGHQVRCLIRTTC